MTWGNWREQLESDKKAFVEEIVVRISRMAGMAAPVLLLLAMLLAAFA